MLISIQQPYELSWQWIILTFHICDGLLYLIFVFPNRLFQTNHNILWFKSMLWYSCVYTYLICLNSVNSALFQLLGYGIQHEIYQRKDPREHHFFEAINHRHMAFLTMFFIQKPILRSMKHSRAFFFQSLSSGRLSIRHF